MPMPMHTQMWSLLVLKMQCNKSCWFCALLTPTSSSKSSCCLHLCEFVVFTPASALSLIALSLFLALEDGSHSCLYTWPLQLPTSHLQRHRDSPVCLSDEYPWIPQDSLLVVLSLLSPIFLNICYQLSTYLMASISLWYSNESQYLS